MDAKYYDRGELSIGNPPLVDLVRKLGSKDLPETEPTTLSAMAYEIARGVLGQRPIIQKIEIRFVHFSKGLETKDESEDNHVVNRSSSTQSAMIFCALSANNLIAIAFYRREVTRSILSTYRLPVGFEQDVYSRNSFFRENGEFGSTQV